MHASLFRMSFERVLSCLERFDRYEGEAGQHLGARTKQAAPETRVFSLDKRNLVYVDHVPELSDGNHAIDTLGWKVVYVNKQIKSVGEKTSLANRRGRRLPAPNGLHVFKPIASEEQLSNAVRSLDALFDMVENPYCRRRTNVTVGDSRFQMRKMFHGGPNNILFITDPKEDKPQPRFEDVMISLKEYDEQLHDFVKKHADYCLKLMGSDKSANEDLQLQLIHYMPNGRGGIGAHIDAVAPFKNTIGPIFTLNMNFEEKAFDLLPTLKPRGTPAVRLLTTLGEITMMDGESRISWSHAIPYGNLGHAYTIAFKFPCQPQHMHDQSGGYNKILDTFIPQNLAPAFREKKLNPFYGLDQPPESGPDAWDDSLEMSLASTRLHDLLHLGAKHMHNEHGVRVEEGKEIGVIARIVRVGEDRNGDAYAIVRINGKHDGGRDYTFGLNHIVDIAPTETPF